MKKKKKKEKKMYDERARLKEFARLKKISGLSYGYKYFDFFQFNKFLSILDERKNSKRKEYYACPESFNYQRIGV